TGRDVVDPRRIGEAPTRAEWRAVGRRSPGRLVARQVEPARADARAERHIRRDVGRQLVPQAPEQRTDIARLTARQRRLALAGVEVVTTLVGHPVTVVVDAVTADFDSVRRRKKTRDRDERHEEDLLEHDRHTPRLTKNESTTVSKVSRSIS